MRVLFVVPPLTGHTNPTVAVGAELITRGHEVAWCGDPGHLAAHLPAGSTIIPAADDLPTDLVQAITRTPIEISKSTIGSLCRRARRA